jgi:arsenate reductase (thioredoxin)
VLAQHVDELQADGVAERLRDGGQADCVLALDVRVDDGLAARLAGGRIAVRSAGSAPAETINPAVRDAMAEIGIDLGAAHPKLLTDRAVRTADVVVTMGCGDACPVYPGKRYEDWALDDPAGRSVEDVRPIRDEIDRRVRALVAELLGE